MTRYNLHPLLLLLILVIFAGCGKKDTLRIFAAQQNGDPVFGARVSLYPTEQDYLTETTPVLTGTLNQEDASTSWAFFESFDLYNGQFFFDIVFQDSIGNWAISGAENQFSGSADGGENIDVGGAQLGLNYHKFLIGANGETHWQLNRVTDASGNVINQPPACLQDQDEITVRKDLSMVVNYGPVQCAAAIEVDTIAFTHQGNHLSVANFYGALSPISVFLDVVNDELFWDDGTFVLHYRKI